MPVYMDHDLKLNISSQFYFATHKLKLQLLNLQDFQPQSMRLDMFCDMFSCPLCHLGSIGVSCTKFVGVPQP